MVECEAVNTSIVFDTDGISAQREGIMGIFGDADDGD